jgi:hypothetical protein
MSTKEEPDFLTAAVVVDGAFQSINDTLHETKKEAEE